VVPGGFSLVWSARDLRLRSDGRRGGAALAVEATEAAVAVLPGDAPGGAECGVYELEVGVHVGYCSTKGACLQGAVLVAVTCGTRPTRVVTGWFSRACGADQSSSGQRTLRSEASREKPQPENRGPSC
jgi:hypothetical protein